MKIKNILNNLFKKHEFVTLKELNFEQEKRNIDGSVLTEKIQLKYYDQHEEEH